MLNPPTPLPKMKRRGVPPNLAHSASLAGNGHGILVAGKAKATDAPEFTGVLEREEGERLDLAKRAVVEETDRVRALLIEREKELERLKKELAESV